MHSGACLNWQKADINCIKLHINCHLASIEKHWQTKIKAQFDLRKTKVGIEWKWMQWRWNEEDAKTKKKKNESKNEDDAVLVHGIVAVIGNERKQKSLKHIPPHSNHLCRWPTQPFW